MLFITAPSSLAPSAKMVDLCSEIQPIYVMERFPNGHGVTILSNIQNDNRRWYQKPSESCIHFLLKHFQFKHALLKMARKIHHLYIHVHMTMTILWMQRYQKRLRWKVRFASFKIYFIYLYIPYAFIHWMIRSGYYLNEKFVMEPTFCDILNCFFLYFCSM